MGRPTAHSKGTAWRLLLLVVSGTFSNCLVQALNLPGAYDSSVRPNNDGIADVVNISVEIISIGRVDELEQSFSVDFVLRAFWLDKRLVNLVERETVFVDNLPSVWIPALSIVNSVSSGGAGGGIHSDPPNSHLHQSSSSSKAGRSIKLKSDGILDYSERVSTKLYCPLSYTKYPFGHQTCQLQLSSNAYTTIHLILIWHGLITQEIPVYDPNYSFHSIDQSSKREKTPTGEYSYIFVDFKLTRWPLSVLARAILPCLFFCVLSYFVTFFMMRKKSFYCMDEPYLSKNPRNKEVLDRTVGDRNDVDAGSCTKQQQQLQFPVIKGTYITPSILRLTTNALLLVLVIIVRQVNFVTAPRVGTITGMDICTGLMAAIIVLCFLLSLQMCYDQWLRRVSSEVIEETGKLTKKVFTILRVSIPIALFIFLFVYFVFCLS